MVSDLDAPKKILVWQWGRFGAGPRFAVLFAEGLAGLEGVEVSLSLSAGAEILRGDTPPHCDLPMPTYASLPGFMVRVLTAPFAVWSLVAWLRVSRPDFAICPLPGPLDLVMAVALRRLRIPFAVVIHDADAHPGERFPLRMFLQRMLCRQATAIATLTAHVADRLVQQKLAGIPRRPLIRLRHPPMQFQVSPRRAREAGTLRLLSFGRLLKYKGLDLLAESLALMGSPPGLSVRVVGAGPESPDLNRLRGLPGVVVENRWVPETEVGDLLSWADAIVLPYREASQSGVAAAAIAANRFVIATNVGGLGEQLAGEPLAIVCEPDAGSIATGIRRLYDRAGSAAPHDTPPPREAWREIGQALMDQMDAAT